jgi:hypothetical protein
MGMSSMRTGVAGRSPGFNPRGGDRIFGKSAATGGAVARDRATWSSLAGRRLPPPSEAFIRELPVEHREMLRAYFEALSRGGPR